jgi:hypothetical protein
MLELQGRGKLPSFMLRLLDLRPHRKVLYSEEFGQLMLHLVQDVQAAPDVSTYVLNLLVHINRWVLMLLSVVRTST